MHPDAPLIRIFFPLLNMGRGREFISHLCESLYRQHRWRVDLTPPSTTVAHLISLQQRLPAQGIVAFPVAGVRGGPIWDLGVPTLAVLSADGDLPVVRSDDVAAGRMAAHHLLHDGWQPHAVFDIDAPWWRLRLQGWREIASATALTQLPAEPEARMAWVRALPSRTAIFAASDTTALGVARAALIAGRALGSDLRIVGVDDDQECFSILPPLTSIRMPLEAVAKTAARTIALMVRGKPVPQTQVLPEPTLVIRGSSDPFIGAEPWLQEIAEQLRMTVASGQRPELETFLAKFEPSRSTINRAWKRVTGRSLMASIQELRREILSTRLDDPRISPTERARSLGLKSLRSLSRKS